MSRAVFIMCDKGRTRGNVYNVELVYAFVNLVVVLNDVSLELIFYFIAVCTDLLWYAQFPRRGTPDLEHVTTSSQEQYDSREQFKSSLKTWLFLQAYS